MKTNKIIVSYASLSDLRRNVEEDEFLLNNMNPSNLNIGKTSNLLCLARFKKWVNLTVELLLMTFNLPPIFYDQRNSYQRNSVVLY